MKLHTRTLVHALRDMLRESAATASSCLPSTAALQQGATERDTRLRSRLKHCACVRNWLLGALEELSRSRWTVESSPRWHVARMFGAIRATMDQGFISVGDFPS